MSFNFKKLNFYKNKIALNLLAKNVNNAKEVYNTMDGNVFIGILSKKFDNVSEGIKYVNRFQKEIPAISIGLGGGDPKQWKMAAQIAAATDPGHVNQVFTSAGYTMGLLKGSGCQNTIVNALINPTGEVGKVRISTGPVSTNEGDVIADVETALAMLKDVGVNSIKFFHMNGDQHLEELEVLANAAVKAGIPMIEPTGGLNTENITQVIKVCLNAGCKKVVPHVYSSLIDEDTGLTQIDDVRNIYNKIKRIY